MSKKFCLTILLSIIFSSFLIFPSHAIHSPVGASSQKTLHSHSPEKSVTAAAPTGPVDAKAPDAGPSTSKVTHKWPSPAKVRSLVASRPFKVHLTAIPQLPESNALTEEGLLAWIEGEKLLSPKIFRPGCLKVEQLMYITSTATLVAETGSAADAIFFIMYDPRCLTESPGSPRLSPIPSNAYRLIFVLKKFNNRADQEKEMRDLHTVEESPQLRSFAKVGDTQYPILKFNEKFYKYKDRNGQTQFFSLSHAAKGKTLWHYIWSYIQEPEAAERRKMLTNALKVYGAFGRTLANFHIKFMKNPKCPFSAAKEGGNVGECYTIVHNDLNPKNVFYHSPHIILIDNATMASSLARPGSTIQDVFFPFTMPASWLMTMSHVGEDKQTLAQAFLKNVYTQFLTSYFHQFKEANSEATPAYFASIERMAPYSVAAFVPSGAIWLHLARDYTQVAIASFAQAKEALHLERSHP